MLLTANANFKTWYDKWCEANHVVNRVNVLGYNFYLYEYRWEIESRLSLLFEQYNSIASKKIIPRAKYYASLNFKPRFHRILLIAFLLEAKIDNKGILTFYGDKHSKDSYYEKASCYIKLFHHTKLTTDKIMALKNTEISGFDVTAATIENSIWTRAVSTADFLYSDLINNQCVDYYFEIVTETWFEENDLAYITEKSIRPILKMTPFIVLGPYKSLAHLRSLGFKTFSPLINELYDNIENPVARIEMIIDEIQRLCALTMDEIHTLYLKAIPILMHNFNHYVNIKKLSNKNEIKNILKVIGQKTD